MTTTRIPVTGSRPEDEYEVLVGSGLMGHLAEILGGRALSAVARSQDQAVETGQIHSDLRDRLSGGRSDDESVRPRNEAVIMRVLPGHDLHRCWESPGIALRDGLRDGRRVRNS